MCTSTLNHFPGAAALDDLNLDILDGSKSRKSSGFSGASASEVQQQRELHLHHLQQQHQQQQQSKSRNCSGGSSISQGFVSSGFLGSTNPVGIPGSASGPEKRTPPPGGEHGHDNVSEPFIQASVQVTDGAAHFQNSAMGMNQFGLFDLTSSPNKQNLPMDPKDLEISRLKEEVSGLRNRLGACDEGLSHARAAYDVWQKEIAIAAKKAEMAMKEKEAAVVKMGHLQRELEELQGSGQYLHAIKRISELPNLPVGVLKAFEWQLRKDLQEVEKVRKNNDLGHDLCSSFKHHFFFRP